jgi:glycosyl transferase family 87
VLGDPRLYWVVVVVVAARRVIVELPVWVPDTADAYSFIGTGRDALAHPGAIYAASAALVARGYMWSVNSPPPTILLAIPFGLAPQDVALRLWVGTNALCAVAGLVFLYRSIGRRTQLTLPIFVLVSACFTPLFEDMRLGQIGGFLMCLSCAAMLVTRSRPLLGGALAGLATSLKFYPAAMALAIDGRRRPRFIGSLAAVCGTVFAITFIPFGSPWFYLTRVLIPVSTDLPNQTHSCFENSTPSLFYRLVGGSAWTMLSSGTWSSPISLPWHLTALALLLIYATTAFLLVGTVWAARRSGWAQPFSMALGLSLGTLVPGHVYTYQFIALLPLTLVLVLTAVQQNRWVLTGVLGLAVWVFVSSPCALVFPGLWNIAGLAIFAVAMFLAAGAAQAPSVSRSATPSSRIPAPSGTR